MENHAVLLVQCPDKEGIVVEITKFISERGGNIISLDQHVDHDSRRFFLRAQWELDNFEIQEEERISTLFGQRVGQRFEMDYKVRFTNRKLRMAVFVTKASHCLYDILYRNRSRTENWNVEIPFVISNHDTLRDDVEPFGIPYHHIPITKETKPEVEAKQLALLKEHDVDFIVLARYMQVLTDDFIKEFPHRIINIHHSFLPAFIGPKPYHHAHKRGVKMIGATTHYVNADLDAGPIIAQDVMHVSHRDSVKEMMRKGRDIEKLVLSEGIRLHLQHKILVHNNKTVVFD